MAQALPETGAFSSEPSVMASIVQTDTAGHFRLERIPPGRYYITAGLVEFPTYYPGVKAIADAKVVVVAGGAYLSGIDFSLSRPVLKVSGRVIREGNPPVAPTQRVLITGGVLLTGGRLVSQNAVIPTDGSFEFVNLPPGIYTIGLSPANGSQPQRITLSDTDVHIDLVSPLTVAVTGKLIIENEGAKPRLALTFTDGNNRFSASAASNGTYNLQLPLGSYRITPTNLQPGFSTKSIVSGSTDLLNEPLQVSAGAALEFVVTLGVSSPPPWVQVKGRVVGGSAGGRVTMTGANAGETLEAMVGPDSTFIFPKVLPGSYTARLTAAATTQPITLIVGNTDVDNWEIVPPVTAAVYGHVTMNGGAPPLLTSLRFTVTEMTGTGSFGTSISSFYVVIGPNGDFSLGLPEGQHRISLGNIPTGYSLKSMTYGSTNLLIDPLKIEGADASKELTVTFAIDPATNWFKVSGRIVGLAPQAGVSGQARVTLGGGASGPVEAAANPDGSFEFPRVAPGSYTARAFASAQGIDVALPLVVAAKDLTDVEIRIPNQKQVAGHVALEDGSAVQSRFWLTLTGAGTISLYTTPQPDGSFVARPPEGEWKVAVGGLLSDFTLKAFTYGDTDLLRSPLKVTMADTQEMRITLAANGSWVKLSGRLIAPNLPGPLESTVRLTGASTFQTSLRADGTFEFPKILAATYSWCCNFGWTSIPAKADVANLVLRSISGRVILEDGTQADGVYVQANDGNGTSAANVHRDGSFVLIVPEGRTYRIAMSTMPAGFYLKSIRYGSTEVAGQQLNVLADQDTSNLQITIARRP